MSAKLTTENSLNFEYGKVEVVAKLPIGNWIVTGKCLITIINICISQIEYIVFCNKYFSILKNVILFEIFIFLELALVSKDNYKTRLVLVAKGNTDLKCSGKEEGTTALNLAYTLTNDRFYGNATVYIYNPRGFTDGYHKFELSRSSTSIVVKVDGVVHNLDTKHFVGSGILNTQVKQLIIYCI